MRIDVVENDERRLRLVVSANAGLYGFFGLLFVAGGVVCLRLLAMDGDSPTAGAMLGLVCIGCGLLILLAIQRVSLTADRAAGTMVLHRRHWLWRPRPEQRIDLDDVAAVHALPFTLQTPRHTVTSFTVRLQRRGEAVDEATSLTFLPMFAEADATRVARLIGDWLGGAATGSSRGTAS